VKCYLTIIVTGALFVCSALSEGVSLTYAIVDTGQREFYDNDRSIDAPDIGELFYGQDSEYEGNHPAYTDNGDGTVTDDVTGLMWQQSPAQKQTLEQALTNVSECRLGGYDDWRVPTIKELYSLIHFSGTDPDPDTVDSDGLIPFIDTEYFSFQYGDVSAGERIIDVQYGSCSQYTGTTMNGDSTMFGVNFADGRIKGYPILNPRTRENMAFNFIYVRGNEMYGENNFQKNSDGTIKDLATGVTWQCH